MRTATRGSSASLCVRVLLLQQSSFSVLPFKNNLCLLQPEFEIVSRLPAGKRPQAGRREFHMINFDSAAFIGPFDMVDFAALKHIDDCPRDILDRQVLVAGGEICFAYQPIILCGAPQNLGRVVNIHYISRLVAAAEKSYLFVVVRQVNKIIYETKFRIALAVWP